MSSSSSTSSSTKPKSGLPKKLPLLLDSAYRPPYLNNLPDLPFDTKSVVIAMNSLSTKRFTKYMPSSLELKYQHEMHVPNDMDLGVDLVIPPKYGNPWHSQPDAESVELHAHDATLLEDEESGYPKSMSEKLKLKSFRSAQHKKNVAWLRRTEYISAEQVVMGHKGQDRVEAKVGYSLQKQRNESSAKTWTFNDIQSQIKAIKKTFEDATKPITQHFSKPDVVPVEVLPIFPDFDMWKYPFAQVIFDSDPAPVGRPVPAQLKEMSQAMIRGVMDESGEQFVAYFLPTEETLVKTDKRNQENDIDKFDDEIYEYQLAREYTWSIKNKADKSFEACYFFSVRDQGVFYNEIETRVLLNKRRTSGQNQSVVLNKLKLCARFTAMGLPEYEIQRNREKLLEPISEEEEEEECGEDNDNFNVQTEVPDESNE